MNVPLAVWWTLPQSFPQEITLGRFQQQLLLDSNFSHFQYWTAEERTRHGKLQIIR